MVSPVRQGDLLAQLRRGVTVLLPGAYAAAALRSAFDAEQRRRGLAAWAAPFVLTWTEWTRAQWTQLITSGVEARLLLNPAQEHSLWRELISDLGPAQRSTGNLDAAADLSRSGWALAEAWKLTPQLRSSAGTHDTRLFAQWTEAFQRRCRDRGYVASASLESVLLHHLRALHLSPPAELALVNMEELTGSQADLVAQLQRAGCFVRRYAMERNEADTNLSRQPILALAANEREELVSAVHWARLQVETARLGNPGVRIGVLLPSTGLDKSELESAFRDVLAPELQAIGADLSSTPWKFAEGEPLLNAALASTALELLRLCREPLPLPRVSTLLLSPYLGRSTERDANACFDAHIVRPHLRLRPEIDLRELALQSAALGRNGSVPAPWLPALQEFAESAVGPRLRRSHAEWMEVCRELLKLAGWPGDRPHSEREQAAQRSWEDTLDQVATLDFAGERVFFRDAFAAVDRLARHAAFHPSRSDASIVALRPEQALGCSWDVLLTLRGNEQHWPASVRPHPLISTALQREHQLPGTHPDEATQQFRSLLASSSLCVATCSLEDADGPVRPSPLFQQLGFLQTSLSAMLPKAKQAARAEPFLILDDAPLPVLPIGELRGGARVLQLQAACPFRAFAELRLGAAELPVCEAGFDTRESGTLLHNALELFWKRVGSQEALRALTTEARHHLLRECIDAAVPHSLATEHAWDDAYVALKKERLQHLLNEWMEQELRRGPFTVAASERKAVLSVGPLKLDVRVDRVDQVEDGLVLVDYKSGYSADPKSWLGERPDEPQLPLYSLLHEPEHVRALAFAHLRAGDEMRWNGYQAEAGILPSKMQKESRQNGPELTAQLREWRSTLAVLATQFSEGRSEVDPKDFAQNCRRCTQRVLCRVDPASLAAAQLGDEEQPVEEVYG